MRLSSEKSSAVEEEEEEKSSLFQNIFLQVYASLSVVCLSVSLSASQWGTITTVLLSNREKHPIPDAHRRVPASSFLSPLISL